MLTRCFFQRNIHREAKVGWEVIDKDPHDAVGDESLKEEEERGEEEEDEEEVR